MIQSNDTEQVRRYKGGVSMLLAAIIAVLALAVGVWSSFHWFGGGPGAGYRTPENFPGTVLPGPGKLIPPFTLQDQHARPFDLSRLKGKWSLLFFGYTHCPDICPTTLATLNNVYAGLEKTAGGVDDVAVVFVSVDPERDNLKQIGEYLGYFNPAFTGVTGDNDALQRFSRSLGALYLRTEGTERSGYLVDHSAAVFVVSPEGRFKALLSPPFDIPAIIAGIDALRG